MSRRKKIVSAEATTVVRLFSVYYFGIMLTNLFSGMGGQLIDTSRTLYVHSLNGSASYAGFMLTLTASAATVTRLLSGRISDKIGRRIVILVGLVIFGLSAISFNIFPFLGALPGICLMRGLGIGMQGTAASAAVADVVPKSRMGEGIGYFGLANPLVSSIGPAIVAGLITIGDFASIYYISAAFIFAGAIVIFFCNYEKDTKFLERLRAGDPVSQTAEVTPESANEADKPAQTPDNAGAGVIEEIDTRIKEDKDFESIKPPGNEEAEPRGLAAFIEKSSIPCAVLNFFTSVANSANLSFLMAYAFHIGVPNPALYYTLSAVCMVVLRVLTGRFSNYFKPVYMIMFGKLFTVASFVFLLMSGSYPILLYIAGATNGISTGIYAPVQQTTVVRMAPDNRRGAAIATYTFTLDIGIAIGAFIWGAVVDNFSYDTMYTCVIVCVVFTIALSFILLRKVPSERQELLKKQVSNT